MTNRLVIMLRSAALVVAGISVASGLWAHEAKALSGEWRREEGVSVRLISGVEGAGQSDTLLLGLDVQLEPGWHTYWRSPGTAGLPPQIQWNLDAATVESDASSNLADATLLYPVPERFTDSGMDAIGYRERVVFPIKAKVNHPGQALELQPSLDLLICNNICLPRHFVLSLKIPVGTSTEGPEAALLKEYLARVPQDSALSGILIRNVEVVDDGLTLNVEANKPFAKPDVLIENEADLIFSAPVATLAENRRSAIFSMRLAEPLPQGKTLEEQPMTITIVDGERGMEQKITLPARGKKYEGADAPQIQPAKENVLSSVPSQQALKSQNRAKLETSDSPLSFSIALLVALVGGFILNLMPCVLPVLSLKVLSVIGHGGNKRQAVRRSFLMTASGIVASFLVLASLTIALRHLGYTLGWGVQFQQPLFLVFLISLVTIFAASLWDLITLRLPYWMTAGWGGWKERRKNAQPGHHLAGDFMTGAFATLLATPCSAPFLGTAVGFALTEGPGEILAIFAALGIGMSAPYLMIAAFPYVASALPKPGAWMIRLRRILGVALGLTALWLIWVLSVQIAVQNAALVGLCMVGIILLLALRRTLGVNRKLVFAGLAVFAFAAFATASAVPIASSHKEAVEEANWQHFDETALHRAVSEGKTVFVDVTADWCLTCKANKRFVLSQAGVMRRLSESGVVAMQADWTRPDPNVTAFLHAYGRYGIPFNIVFGPRAPQGIVLPELLSQEVVIKALDQAGEGSMRGK